METTIIIPCKDEISYTKACLKSISRNTKSPYKIIVVDDGSTEETKKSLQGFENITLVKNQGAPGFPSACNTGMRMVGSEFFVIMNNDVEVTKEWLSMLLFRMRQDPKLGILGPITNRVSGPQQDCCAGYTTREGMERFAITVNNRRPSRIEFFPRIVFFCTVFRTELYKKIGGLDEKFGLGNFDDDDYCMRARIAGFITAIDFNVFIHHYGSRTFGKMGKGYIDLLHKNKNYFMQKWNPKNLKREHKK